MYILHVLLFNALVSWYWPFLPFLVFFWFFLYNPYDFVESFPFGVEESMKLRAHLELHPPPLYCHSYLEVTLKSENKDLRDNDLQIMYLSAYVSETIKTCSWD